MNKLIAFSIFFIALSLTNTADAQCTVNGRLIGGQEHWPGTLVVASGQTTTTTRVDTDGAYSFRLRVGEYRLWTRWERDPSDEGWPMFRAVSPTVDAYSRTINCRDQDVIRGVDFALRQDYRNNIDECLIWCASSGSCVKCSDKPRCGRGFTRLRSFSGSGGREHYACKAFGEDNHEACNDWCDENSSCAKCSTKYGCGSGYKRLKSFTGVGRNWHGCEHR